MRKKDNLVLIAVGPDSVGLIEKISEFIAQRGCNIEDSKMAVFVGEFALILLISGDSDALSELERSVNDLSSYTGLNVWIKHPSGKKAGVPSLPYRLTASCMDHPGVVYRLSGELRKLGVNIESMETHTYQAPVTGTPIFRLEALVSVPSDVNVNTLRAQFGQIERDENIDIEISLLSTSG